MTSHNRQWKEVKKEEITKLANEYPVIAVATLEELPANIISLLRKRLNTDAKIIVAKTRVVKKALEAADLDTSKLDSTIQKSVAIIFSKKNPFELFSFIKKNKGEAVAKEGDLAPQDIIVQAGDTGLPPGPALSILKGAGLKVAVQGPTISVVSDKVVTKKGDPVSKDVADVLGKLNMKPMRIGMNVLGVLEKSTNDFYTSQALDIDEEELFNKFIRAYQNALNLSVEAEYFNTASAELIVIKAQRSAKIVSDLTNVKNSANEIEEEAKEIVEQVNDSNKESSEFSEIDKQSEDVVENASSEEVKENN